MFSFFSMWSWIVKQCASSRDDLPAAPPGSPLALTLIYSLIHLCCCHMASLSLPPPSTTPSIIPLSLPPLFSYLRVAHLGGLSIRACPAIPPSLPSTFLFPSSSLLSLSACLHCCNRAPCLLRRCCSSLPRSAQIRSCHRQRLILERAARVLCHANETHSAGVGGREKSIQFRL